MLTFLLDDDITTGISKQKIEKTVSNPVDTDMTLEELMDYLAENNTGRDADLAVVQSFIGAQPDDMKVFCRQLVTKSLKLGIDSKSVNAVIPNLVRTFDVMLGTSIEKCKIKEGIWFSVSHKLNGNRCVFYRGDFYTRQGKKHSGLEHIKTELLKLTGSVGMVVDGELVYKNKEGLSDSEAFQVGTGIANSKSGDKTELKLIVFDTMPADEFDSGRSTNTYRVRKEKLIQMGERIAQAGMENVAIVDVFYEGTDQAEIWKWLDYAEENDLEGVVLNLDTPYECKRTKNLIKVKKFYTMDLEVVGVEAGSGRLSGTLGALIVDYKGNTVNVGSGFDDATRADIWSNRDDIIGRIIEVKYKEISKDKKTGLESLQFPIFVCVREHGKEVSYG